MLKKILLLVLAIILVSCGEKSQESNEKSIIFKNLKDSEILFGSSDENDSLEGIQYSVLVEAKGIDKNENITLRAIQGNVVVSEIVQTEKKDGKIIANFSEFDFSKFDGYVKLSVEGSEIFKVIEIKITGNYNIEITSPINNSNLKNEDDNDKDKFFLQKDIKVNVSGAKNSSRSFLYLDIYKGDYLLKTYSSIAKNGEVIFKDINFTSGEYQLQAYLLEKGEKIKSALININVNYNEVCKAELFPKDKTNIFVKYLKDNKIKNKKIPLLVKSNCPQGYNVQYSINEGTDKEEKITSKLIGQESTISLIKYHFPEDEELGKSSNVKIYISKDNNFTNNVLAQTNYKVDTFAPELILLSEKQNISFENDVDNSKQGIQYPVKIKINHLEDNKEVILESNQSGSWQEIKRFNKDSNEKEIILDMFAGNYALRAKAKDKNNQIGISNLLPLKVIISDCIIEEVKINNTVLNSQENILGDSDIMEGKSTFTLKTSPACGGYNAVIKKADEIVTTYLLDSEDGISTFKVPFENKEEVLLNINIDNINSSYPIKVVIEDNNSNITRIEPINENLIYVNAETEKEGTIKDLNKMEDEAQAKFKVLVENNNEGKISLYLNDTLVETKDISSENEEIEFETNLEHKIDYIISFKLISKTGNIIKTKNLYNAKVDIIKPGNIDTPQVSADTSEPNNLKINLSWNQENSGDDNDTGNINHYIIKYTNLSEFPDNKFEKIENVKTIKIENPEMNNEVSVKLDANLESNYYITIRAYDKAGNYSKILKTRADGLFSISKYTMDNYVFVSGASNNIYKIIKVKDLNGDNKEDFVISQTYANNYNGKVFVYFSKDSVEQVQPDIILDGINGESLGSCVASGDFNGDGYNDLVLGAEYAGFYGGNYYPGTAKIYYGTATGLENNSYTIKNSYLDNTNNLKDVGGFYQGGFATACIMLNDINNDNKDELVIGQKFSKDGGRVFVISGRESKSNITIDQENPNTELAVLSHDFETSSNFSTSIDTNNNKIIVGAPLEEGSGKVAIFKLDENSFNQTIIAKKDNSNENVKVITGNNKNFGYFVEAGDLDNENKFDLLVSSIGKGINLYYNENYNESILISKPETKINGFASSIKVRDFNDDAKNDILVVSNNRINIYLNNGNKFEENSLPSINYSKDELEFTEGILKSEIIDLNNNNNSDIIICNSNNTITCIIKNK